MSERSEPMLITGKIPFFCGQKSSSMRILSLVALFVLTFIYFGINTTKFGDTYLDTTVLRKFAEVTEVCGSFSNTFEIDSNYPNSSRN